MLEDASTVVILNILHEIVRSQRLQSHHQNSQAGLGKLDSSRQAVSSACIVVSYFHQFNMHSDETQAQLINLLALCEGASKKNPNTTFFYNS